MESQDLQFSWRGIELAGTLHRPGKGTKHPVVIMLQGSGATDRDSDGFFVEIRERFLADGLATFAFDKPGCGASTGDWRDYALMDRADQAETARTFISEHAGLETRLVGFWGHSQGGWVVQILASRNPDLPFAVANSAPSIGVVEQDLHGCRDMLLSAGLDEEVVEDALVHVTKAHDAAAQDMSYEEVRRTLIDGLTSEPWYGYLPLDDEKDWALVRSFVLEGYDPHDALNTVTCPFLAIYGAKDPLLPAWQCAVETGECLERSGAPDATVVIFPQGNHRIQHDATGTFVDGYLDLVGSWVARRARAALA